MTQSQKYALFYLSVVSVFLESVIHPDCQKRNTTWTDEQKKKKRCLRRQFSASSCSIEKQIPKITTVEQIRPSFNNDTKIVQRVKQGYNCIRAVHIYFDYLMTINVL